MAEKKSDAKVKQTPILDTETKITAPENNAVSNKETKTTTSAKKNTVKKSRRRTSLDEFAITKGLRPEVKAGLKTYLKGETFHFDEDWDKIYNEYRNRKLQ